jgi:sigma-B regulation protein RsbU (phosphoserine phosphatase)
MPDLDFAVASERLAVGDTLFAYTDGVVDARDPQDEAFGEDRLMALLQLDGTSAAGLLERIDQALSAHIGTAEQFDDVAMLATRSTA